MAEMIFEITGEAGKRYMPEPLTFEWSRDADAPCDSIRLTFLFDGIFPEAYRIRVYCNGVPVFDGSVDYQRQCGDNVFLFARSLAALLVDNEAPLLNYQSPCVNTLFIQNALPYGLKNGLENYYSDGEYAVTKGTSCYGAVNRFVKAFCGKNIAVSPEGELYVPKGNIRYTPDSRDVISEKRIINRSTAVSRIDYKTDGAYVHHRISRTLEEKGVLRTQKVNMSAVPHWQRNTLLAGKMAEAAGGYYAAELTVDGIAAPELYSPLEYPGYEGYYITGLLSVSDRQGERTKITLCKELKLKEADYVA